MGFTADQITFTDKGIDISVLFKTKQTEEFMRELKAKIDPHLERMAEDIRKDATARAPIQTPPDDWVVLKESITQKKFGPRAKGMGFRVRTNTRLFKSKEAHGYGAHVEFGTSHAKATPFLYPAYDVVVRNAELYLSHVL